MLRLSLAVGVIVISLVVLELARHEVSVTRYSVGQTPVSRYAKADADGPAVIVAHGFAGSQQMMQGYTLPLARAGYRVFAFDFLGHGRHSLPMSGDVSSTDGTTRLLVAQTNEVIDAIADGQDNVTLLGHSMATDILVRVAQTRNDVGPTVLISAFSKEIDAHTPRALLHVTGAWEPRLRDFALESLQMVDPAASEGETAINGPVSRRAVIAPLTEHVSVLYSRAGRREALAWLDTIYGRSSNITILPTGLAILSVLAGLVIVFRPISALLPTHKHIAQGLNPKQTATVLLIPTAFTPLCALLPLPDFLPVLVANYLVLHLFVYGALQLVLLRRYGISTGALSWPSLCLLLVFCALIGCALDRYTANFWPTAERFWIIAIMTIGATAYMISDSVLMSNQSFFMRLCSRASFLVSLGFAVALDFEGLFFLILIAPVLVLFYLVFGPMAQQASKRAGPLTSGIALGVILAWALGVSFPLFQA